MPDTVKKKEGFQSQKAIVIPRDILNNRCAKNNVISTLYVTDIGYYPRAKFHHRERILGADQHILIYCHEGRGSIAFDKTGYEIEPGEFFIIPAKTAHRYVSDNQHPWTIYWILFSEWLFSNDKYYRSPAYHPANL